MRFTPELTAELELLALYKLSTNNEGLKVHKNAAPQSIAAMQRLHAKGLVTQADGGYLTALGHDAAEHAHGVLTILCAGGEHAA
ncbi:MAG: TIGR02647 family protein [Gammaproteobacteria bacterium]|nr:TIGR02647 family protein [Gammaproteobacteria bacterium]